MLVYEINLEAFCDVTIHCEKFKPDRHVTTVYTKL